MLSYALNRPLFRRKCFFSFDDPDYFIPEYIYWDSDSKKSTYFHIELAIIVLNCRFYGSTFFRIIISIYIFRYEIVWIVEEKNPLTTKHPTVVHKSLVLFHSEFYIWQVCFKHGDGVAAFNWPLHAHLSYMCHRRPDNQQSERLCREDM